LLFAGIELHHLGWTPRRFWPALFDRLECSPMRVLDRYIVLCLARYTALSLGVLLVLMAIFLFVNEQGWVGPGNYGQWQALRFVMLQLPGTALEFLPVAALLGALLGLGQLARGSEFTVMRAAGIS